jgi:hypothetical protein
MSSRCSLEEGELPARLFLTAPVGCLAFGFEPCFDEGDGAAVGGNAVRRREVGTVSGFGDRKVPLGIPFEPAKKSQCPR